ncbi:unnamed protein product [Cylindrotheca closterium]|uniref:Helicase-associated domain-containing protein n=1 Tax=Cylindrotheca closterium TaxID=2856 RepID=A0AAD2G8I9_9STRA|nr:unnamed protein product [Cylindrotheca closterium]
MLPKGSKLRGWYEKYDELVEFWKEHGHFVLPVKPQFSTLQGWINTQRGKKIGGALGSVVRKSHDYLLDRIGFPWRSDRIEFDWQLWYNELVQFWKEHGHLEVKHTENLPLYDWMIRQRQNYKGTGVKLTDHQMEELEKIGFRW